jgi:hypothetical protein
MSHMFTGHKYNLLRVYYTGADVRAKLVMSNTTADTDVDADKVADIGTLDEYNGSGYTEATLTTSALQADPTNNRGEYIPNNFSFGATVAAGTRQAVGILFYKRISGVASVDEVIGFYDGAPFPTNGTGSAFDVTINAEGLEQTT